MDPPVLHPGQHVHVYAGGAWRPGRIIKTNRTRGLVDYVSNQAGDHRTRVFAVGDIYPARGVHLVPARHLRAGMTAVLDSGDRTIQVAYRHEPRRRLIRFIDATEVHVNAGTVLRARKS